MERSTISGGGLAALLTMFFTTAIIFPPSALAEISLQDGWLATLCGTAIGFAGLGLALLVVPRSPVRSIPEWIETVLGRVAGRLVNIVVLGWLLLTVAVVVRHVMAVAEITVLPTTPHPIVIALTLLPAALAARLGIEVLARTSQLYLIIVTLAFAGMLALLAPDIDLKKLAAISAVGFKPVALGAVVAGAYFTTVVFGLWLYPYVRNRQQLLVGTVSALTLFGLFFVSIMFYAEGIFGYREMQRMLIPTLDLVRAIRLGEVLERMDIILVSVWLLATFVNCSVLIYLACLQLAWIVGTTIFRPLSFPVAAFTGVFAIVITDNLERFVDFLTIGAYIPFTYSVTLALPAALLAVGALRGKVGGQQRES